MDVIHDVKYSLGLAYGTGTADRTGATLDMSGFQGVRMVFTCVAASGTTSYKAQSDSDSAFGSAQDIEGTAQTVANADDGDIFIIDILNPPERYVRCYVDKDTSNTCAESVVYEQYGPDTKPTTQATVVNHEHFEWPAVGTA